MHAPPQPAVGFNVVRRGGGGERGGAAGGDMQGWSCPICYKYFDTEKAMFGHQRVHKNKSYRGAFPPPTFDPEGSPEPQQQVQVAYLSRPVSPPLEAQVGRQEGGGGSSSNSVSWRNMNIDLNRPFCEDEE